MIIDCHTHIFPKKIRENRQNYFENEEAFKILYDSPKSKLVGAKELVNLMDEQNIDKAVIFGFPWKNSKFFTENNNYIIESVQKYSNRLIGFACFDIFNQDSYLETLRCLNSGLKGVGELAFYDLASGINNICLEKLEPIMKACEERNLPVLIHTNEPIGHIYPGKTQNTLAQIYNLIKKFKNNKIILAHWGGGIFFYSVLKKEVKEFLKNIYFDTAASPFLYDFKIYSLAISLGFENNILFGSDFPLIKPNRYLKELEQSSISKEQINKILGLNFLKILEI